MATAAAQDIHEIAIFRNQNKLVEFSVHKNVAGITHEESLIHPQPHGNSLNWVVGHLVCIYNRTLPMLGQPPVALGEKLERYDRGSKVLEKDEALPFEALLASFDEAVARWDAGLASLNGETLDQKAPFSPFNDPNETLRSLLGFFLYHQSYHAGQTGVLRRVAGKSGAI